MLLLEQDPASIPRLSCTNASDDQLTTCQGLDVADVSCVKCSKAKPQKAQSSVSQMSAVMHFIILPGNCEDFTGMGDWLDIEGYIHLTMRLPCQGLIVCTRCRAMGSAELVDFVGQEEKKTCWSQGELAIENVQSGSTWFCGELQSISWLYMILPSIIFVGSLSVI